MRISCGSRFRDASSRSHFAKVELCSASVPTKLNELVKNGYTIVIITNQGNIDKGKLKIDSMKVVQESECVE